MRVKVNTCWDVVFGASMHHGPFPPALQASAEGATQMWVGFFLFRNRLTHSVRHKKREIVQKDHDIGPLMPHITFPQVANPWYAIIYPLSSCEVKFSAAKVRADGDPVGCSQIFPVPLPMLTCGEPVSMPLAFSTTTMFNTVSVGLRGWDILAGYLSIVASLVIDYVFHRLSGGFDKAELVKVQRRFGDIPFREFVKKSQLRQYVWKGIAKHVFPEASKDGVTKWATEWAIKGAFSNIVGLGTSALQGDPTYKVGGTALGFIDAEVSVSKDTATGDWSWYAQMVYPTKKVDTRLKVSEPFEQLLGADEP